MITLTKEEIEEFFKMLGLLSETERTRILSQSPVQETEIRKTTYKVVTDDVTS